MKPTTTQKRAMALCQSIRLGITESITVEWKKSREYGHNPRIDHRGEKATNVSGCGYCKLSTALADALCYLGETPEEMQAVARTGGAGERSTIEALRKIGWELKPTARGKTFDVYTIARATVPA